MPVIERPVVVVAQSDLVRFGREIARIRKALGMEQQDVARRLAEILGQFSQGQYSDIERAYVRPGKEMGTVPDDAVLAALSSVLGVPMIQLHSWLGRLSGEEVKRLRGAGIIYEAGWDELSEENKQIVLNAIDRLLREEKGA